MLPQDHQIAVDFCKLVETSDLLEYLGLAKDSTAEEAVDALAKKRKRMQGMQNNPKFQVSVRYLIKHYRTLEEVLKDPAAHVAAMRKEREKEKLPLLEMAIQCIMADGTVSPREEAFARQSALSLGISEETYEEALREHAQQAGVSLEQILAGQGPPIHEGAERTQATEGEGDDLTEETAQKVRGAEGYGWWDATFTKLLLETIPGGPGDMVDIYCRTALTAQTVLPLRAQITYLGVDRSAERLDHARRVLPDVGGRVRLAQGESHALPIPDTSVDFVVGIRALANVPDTVPIFAEAHRVLRPGGRMILAEPDGLSEAFYFDGNLFSYNEAFARLGLTVDAAMGTGPGKGESIGRPGIALGPLLAMRMEHAGLVETKVSVHASNAMKNTTFARFSSRLRKYPAALAKAAGLDASCPELVALNAEVDRLEAAIPGDRMGMAGYVLPIFLCVGVKD